MSARARMRSTQPRFRPMPRARSPAQGVWQSAPVAVKFMLAEEPQHVNAAALEGIVSSAVRRGGAAGTGRWRVTKVLPYRT